MTQTFCWQGRTDTEDGTNAKRWHQIATTQPTQNCLAAILGFACDEGVKRNQGRPGAKNGPDAIRLALSNLAWHGQNGYIGDLANIVCSGQQANNLEKAQKNLGQAVKTALTKYKKLVVLGGGHETAAGNFEGLMGYVQDQKKAGQPNQTLGIINLDAHFDLRKPKTGVVSSGTPFYQIRQLLKEQNQKFRYLCLGIAENANTQALFERSKEWEVEYLLDTEMRAHLLPNIFAKIDGFLKSCDYLYLSIDLDVLPHWQMPAVSAPAAYGVELAVVEEILHHLSWQNVQWPLSDIVEFNPAFDVDQKAAKVAARICDKLIRQMTTRPP